MVAEDGRDRGRTSGEEEAPDFGGEEPVAPTPIVLVEKPPNRPEPESKPRRRLKLK